MWASIQMSVPEKVVTVGGSLQECFARLSEQEFQGDQTKAQEAKEKGEVRFARVKINTIE